MLLFPNLGWLWENLQLKYFKGLETKRIGFIHVGLITYYETKRIFFLLSVTFSLCVNDEQNSNESDRRII